MSRHAMGLGQSLRLERERRRISLDQIARASRIRRDYLELIDADRLEALPPGAYAKGFIRAYASFLGLDHRPYVKAYEERCGRPAPELSAVVRQPVRVPSAVHPRAWRLAASGGVAALVLLGVLGILRSGDERASRPPTPSSQAEVAALIVTPPPTAPPTPNPFGAVVVVEAVGGPSWVAASRDGEVVFDGLLEQGRRMRFQGRESVHLVLGRARNVRIVANGREVGTPQGDIYRGTFTPTTRELPPSEPR